MSNVISFTSRRGLTSRANRNINIHEWLEFRLDLTNQWRRDHQLPPIADPGSVDISNLSFVKDGDFYVHMLLPHETYEAQACHYAFEFFLFQRKHGIQASEELLEHIFCNADDSVCAREFWINIKKGGAA
ncbi:MAG: hypothetical protein WCO00_08890 [Rhodospirillaceae bacterium]